MTILILLPAVSISCFPSISDLVKPLPLALSTKVCIPSPLIVKSPHVINPLASNVPKVKLDVNNISACFPFNDDVKVLILSATSISPNELCFTFFI